MLTCKVQRSKYLTVNKKRKERKITMKKLSGDDCKSIISIILRMNNSLPF